MDKAVSIPAAECPVCHYRMDAASIVDPKKKRQSPKENDLSVCLKCGEIMRFDKDLHLVQMTPEELKDLKSDQPEDFLMLRHMQSLIQARKRNN